MKENSKNIIKTFIIYIFIVRSVRGGLWIVNFFFFFFFFLKKLYLISYRYLIILCIYLIFYK
jgi:hypothetical protein